MESGFKEDLRQERRISMWKHTERKKNHTHLFNNSKNMMKLPIKFSETQ